MTKARIAHSATLLQDGRVLVAGGCGPVDCRNGTSSAEIYDPESEPWTLHAEAVDPLAAIQFSGTWDGAPWTIPNWTTSREDGTVEVAGTSGADSVGHYWLWFHAGGNVSNGISIRIEDCVAVFQR